jgi:hypothetical protein
MCVVIRFAVLREHSFKQADADIPSRTDASIHVHVVSMCWAIWIMRISDSRQSVLHSRSISTLRLKYPA